MALRGAAPDTGLLKTTAAGVTNLVVLLISRPSSLTASNLGSRQGCVWDKHQLSHTWNVVISFDPESQLLWIEEKVEGRQELPLPSTTRLPPKSLEASSLGMTSWGLTTHLVQ